MAVKVLREKEIPSYRNFFEYLSVSILPFSSPLQVNCQDENIGSLFPTND